MPDRGIGLFATRTDRRGDRFLLVPFLRQVTVMDLRLGAPVRFNGRVYRIHGFTPIGAGLARVMLEDIETLEVIEVAREELEPD